MRRAESDNEGNESDVKVIEGKDNEEKFSTTEIENEVDKKVPIEKKL